MALFELSTSISSYASVLEVGFGLNAAGVAWRDLRNRAVGDLDNAGAELIKNKLVLELEGNPNAKYVVKHRQELTGYSESLTMYSKWARWVCVALAAMCGVLLLCYGMYPADTYNEILLLIMASASLGGMPGMFLVLNIYGNRKLKKFKRDCNNTIDTAKEIMTESAPDAIELTKALNSIKRTLEGRKSKP